ncbi:MAG: heavy metal translocating P-type ATPase, partial [candidate division WOR-3 bacterium]|nr:heavy metal translocating P-type ATPase [candidate division WOR-3 bacterium]
EAAFAIERLATVMVITCPHALGLAIPLVTAVSTSISAQNGLLIRNRTAFESAGKITVIVFDKTGTLTEGEFGVSIIESHDDNISNEEILSLAASIEQSSEHPIGKAILKKAEEEDVKLKDAGNINIEKGKGIEGEIGGEQIQLFSPSEAEERDIEIKHIDNADGKTIIIVIKNSKHIGTIALEDEIREESYSAVAKLQEAGIKCIMLTGDNEETASRVAEELGLDDFKAGVLPDEKEKEIRKLQDEGEFVAMTGDGINDAPALARADIGIAVGTGTDIAAETADILLTESNPDDILKMITFGKKTYSKMIQNLFWATGYNVIAIPLAAGVLYNQGIMISPALGAALMSLSTVIVAINAKLLKI